MIDGNRKNNNANIHNRLLYFLVAIHEQKAAIQE